VYLDDGTTGGYTVDFNVTICAEVLPVCVSAGVGVGSHGAFHPYGGVGPGFGGGVKIGAYTGQPDSGFYVNAGCAYGPVAGGIGAPNGPYGGSESPPIETKPSATVEGECTAIVGYAL
jgi:hypothetical protein